MKPITTKQELRIRGAEALRSVLAEVSGTKVREISHSVDQGSDGAFIASVDVYGRQHTLACEIAQDVQPAHLRALISELYNGVACAQTDATPVIIAQHISDEARDVCKQGHAGFLDLEGNARIALGEVFILKRTMPNALNQSSATQKTLKRTAQNTAA